MAAPRRDTAASERFDGARFLIVEGRFYDDLNDMMIAGARRAFAAAGAEADVVTVPGALELPLAEFGLPGEPFDGGFGEAALPGSEPAMGLADWLALAREDALSARRAEDRSHRALYDAVSRAYDFALAAEQEPEDFAELVEDAGLKVQERAPLIPLLKLVFGTDYDKTRLTEFATVIGHGQRLGLAPGSLGDLLAETPGGLKELVREERRLRRLESGRNGTARDSRDARVDRLRRLQPRALESVRADREFAVLVVRRMDDGEIALLGEVEDDPALLDRAARHLLA